MTETAHRHQQGLLVKQYCDAAWALQQAGKLAGAAKEYNSALQAALESGDSSARGEILISVAELHWRLQEHAEAMSCYDEALSIARTEGISCGLNVERSAECLCGCR